MSPNLLRTAWPGNDILPGLTVAAIIALASRFVAEHYGAPAMLMALLFGIALNFLGTEARTAPGIGWASKTLLRMGVALLGLRISLDLASDLGLGVVALVLIALTATIVFGLLVARFFGFRIRFAFLSAASVAICGASAAMAVAAILPKDEKSEDRLVFTVVGVTVLSTLAMIVYPVILTALSMDDRTAGIFIGATVHDVAQVVGAGYSISTEAGDAATFVKLMRVVSLAPVVILGTLALRRWGPGAEDGTRPPLLPLFVAVFLGLALLSVLGLVPAPVAAAGSWLSGWFLLIAIAAVGLKTVPGEVLKVGLGAALLLVAETLFLAVLVAALIPILT